MQPALNHANLIVQATNINHITLCATQPEGEAFASGKAFLWPAEKRP